MKTTGWLMCAAICMTVLGLILRNTFQVFDIVLAILGIVLFLAAFMVSAYRNGRKCPHCGAVYHGVLASLKQRDGMIRCYQCGTIIHLNPDKK